MENEKCCVFLPVLEQQTLARTMKITNSLLQMSQFMLKTKLTAVALYIFLCDVRLDRGVV